jgi:hypothetical protein
MASNFSFFLIFVCVNFYGPGVMKKYNPSLLPRFFSLPRMKRRPLRSSSLFLAALLLSASLFTACSISISSPEDTAVNVTVQANSQITVRAGETLATIPATAFGMNTAVWDNNLLDAAVPDLLRQAGITMLRFPGGSTADVYHWQDHSTTRKNGPTSNPLGYVNPNNTFDAFMGLAQSVGAQPFITVNYGTNYPGTNGGDPAEAAAWVQYANVAKHYGIKYWEVGNEVYANGTYPNANWEADFHAAKGPATYASNVLQYVQAMKAVDPTIKIGVSLTTPSLYGNTTMQDWDSTVLSTACSQIDFVDIHWYPQNHADPQQADAQLLASPTLVPQMLKQTQQQLTQYCGAHAQDVQIFLGEVNTGIVGKQSVSLVNALFLSDVYMSWLEHGGANVSWWDLHNGIDLKGTNDPSLYGSTSYGDNGILSNSSCSSGQCEPPTNQPFPPYYALRMLSLLGKPGDQMVNATSQEQEVSVHAVKQANGNLAVLLINKSPSTTFHLSFSLTGYTPAKNATKYVFGMNSTQIDSQTISVRGSSFTQDLAPYSLTTLVFTP